MTGVCSRFIRYRSILSIIAIGLTLIASVFILYTLIHIPKIYAMPTPGSSHSNSELSIGDIRQHRILLLGGIHEAVNQIPDSAFTNIHETKGLKAKLLNDTNPDSGKIYELLRSDQARCSDCKIIWIENRSDENYYTAW